MPKETFAKVIYQDLAELKDGRFEYKINLPFDVSECVIKQISYSVDLIMDNWDVGTYLIWSSLINDYVGCFSTANSSQSPGSTPNTILKIQQPKTDRIIFAIEQGYNTIPKGYFRPSGVPGSRNYVKELDPGSADYNPEWDPTNAQYDPVVDPYLYWKPEMGTLCIVLEFHK